MGRAALSVLACVAMLLRCAEAEPIATSSAAVTPPLVPSPPKPADAAGKIGPLVKKKPERHLRSALAGCGSLRKVAPAPKPAARAGASPSTSPSTGTMKPDRGAHGIKPPPAVASSLRMPGRPTGTDADLPRKLATFFESPRPLFGPTPKGSAVDSHLAASRRSARCSEPSLNEGPAGWAARHGAVHYLGTIDCRHFPEAEEVLLAALRCDPSEIVRVEAAAALGNGSCTSRRTVQALRLVISGGSADANPTEVSTRVKAAALTSLQMCLAGVDALPPAQAAEAPVARLYFGDPPSGASDHEFRQVRYLPTPENRRKAEDAIALAWRALAERVSAPEAPLLHSVAGAQNLPGHDSLRQNPPRLSARANIPRSREEITSAPRQASENAAGTGAGVLGLTPIGRIPAQP
jgi:hypothetical protein